jgi:multiple sugar transport system substrate-binding protein
VVLASLAVAVSPVARAATSKDSSVTIRFLTWDLPVLTDNFVNPCAKQYPNIHVKVERDYSSGYDAKLQTEFAAGTAPDIFLNSETTTMEWAFKGLLLDQVPYRKALGLPYGSNYMVGPVEYRLGNKIFGYPNVVSTMVIYYNKDTLDQAHVAYPPSDVAHAWTWDQFVAAGKQLTVDRQGRHPDDKGFDPNHIQRYGVEVSPWWAPILALLNSNGGSVFDATYTHYLMDSPEAVQVIQDIADLSLKYHIAPTPTELSSGAGTISLASGRLGLSLDGTWQVYFYQREHNAKWPVSRRDAPVQAVSGHCLRPAVRGLGQDGPPGRSGEDPALLRR